MFRHYAIFLLISYAYIFHFVYSDPLRGTINSGDIICLAKNYQHNTLTGLLVQQQYPVKNPFSFTIDLSYIKDLKIKVQVVIDNGCKPTSGDQKELIKQLFHIVMGDDDSSNALATLNSLLSKLDNVDAIYAGDDHTLGGEGMTALMWAVDRDHPSFVKALVEKKAQVNKSDSNQGWSPLHFAAARGELALVDYLIDKGALINAKNGSNQTPLQLAISNNDEKNNWQAVIAALKQKNSV